MLCPKKRSRDSVGTCIGNEMDLHRLMQEHLGLLREEGQSLGGSSPQYGAKGPPTTHPSTGLSYLRTGRVRANRQTPVSIAVKRPLGRAIAAQERAMQQHRCSKVLWASQILLLRSPLIVLLFGCSLGRLGERSGRRHLLRAHKA